MPPIGGRNTSRSRPRHQLGIHAAGLLEQRRGAGRPRATPKRSATPGRYQTGSIAALVTAHVAVLAQDLAVGLEPPGGDRARMISGMSMCALVTAMVGRMSQPSARRSANTSPPDGPRDRARRSARARPLRVRADLLGRRRVGEIRHMDGVELPRRHGERAIDRVGAGMGADHVPAMLLGGRDQGAALRRGGGAPMDRGGTRPPVGCEVRMICRFMGKRPASKNRA